MTNTDQPLGFVFPCSFPLKVFGYDANDFEALVLAVVRRHVGGDEDLSVTSRQSQGGKYLAVTVTFTAESRQQLDALYLELSQNKRVLMTL
jgi:putative lipoic acid-binding regulatory protein